MALVLIVDDSPTDVHIMQKALEQGGFRTASAADGGEGIRKARELHPDLILMDIVMPGLNGFQATRQLANDPETRSADLVQENLDRLKALFPEAFVEGKVDFEVLKQLLGGTVETGDEKQTRYRPSLRSTSAASMRTVTTVRPVPSVTSNRSGSDDAW